jgi:hypothetical protein
VPCDRHHMSISTGALGSTLADTTLWYLFLRRHRSSTIAMQDMIAGAGERWTMADKSRRAVIW